MDKITPLSSDPKNIKERMRKARVKRNLTVGELSRLSGVSLKRIEAIEKQDTKKFALFDLDRVRKALGLSLSYVMDGEEETL
jgi:transcriptional regulator with XRE-family HTH domain